MSIENVPVIDITQLDKPETLAALDEACREWGFFQVVGHGIDDGVTRTLQRQMRSFFAQPIAAKRAISRTATNPWGFFDRELTKNTLDWKQVYDFGPAFTNDQADEVKPQWPSALPSFEPAVLDFYNACEVLAFHLLGAISVNLGMSADHLGGGFQTVHTSFLRMNYYPICPAPAQPQSACAPGTGHLGVNHHTDAGALTLLLQDEQPGLEVFRDGRWHLVEPRNDALVVNIGDIIQVWSNDRYRASLHRVMANATAQRFSAPFFFNPAYDMDYEPLPTTIDALHPRRYQTINWGEFRNRRSAGDYADCGEEVQISQYQTQGRSR
jgi:isopenicillin N synthase-like dioxygenase